MENQIPEIPGIAKLKRRHTHCMTEIFNQKEIMENVTESEHEDASMLLSLCLEAVRAADGYQSMRKAIKFEGDRLRVAKKRYPLNSDKRIYVLGFGKAAEPMAKAVYDVLGDRIKGGIVLVRSGTRKNKTLGRIKVLEGAHPTPTPEGYKNAKKLTNFAKKSPKKDSIYLVLISGGGSSIYADFHPDLKICQGIKLNDFLVNTDAEIQEINAVRKHNAEGKGGQLAKILQGAKIIPLIISDVPGNPLDTIASGPTSEDTTTFLDAKGVLEKYKLWDEVHENVRERILKGINGEIPETPKHGDPCFKGVCPHIIADAMTACNAVKEKIIKLYGKRYSVWVCPRVMQGKVSESLARELLDNSKPGFTVLGHEYNYGADPDKAGEGGRQLHLLLLMLRIMKKKPEKYSGIYVIGIATDGKDGNSWAGALITPSLIHRVNLEDIEKAKKKENSGGFFREKGCLIRMKSEYGLDDTGTNVNNIMIIFRKSTDD